MTREQFPHKRPGDGLTAGHINDLSAVAGRFGSISPGSNAALHNGRSIAGFDGMPPWMQHIVEVSSLTINDFDEENSGLYLVRFRWFSESEEGWQTDEDDNEWELDTTGLGGLALSVGSILVAYWDGQREMFIPVFSSSISEIYFELYENHAPGMSSQAYPRSWNGSAYETDTDADTFEVVDVLSRFRGRGRDEEIEGENDSGGTRGKHGSFGLARSRNGQWEIDSMQPHAAWFKAKVNESNDFTTGADPEVDLVTVILPVDTALLMADVDDFKNLFRWNGDDNAVIVGNWNDATAVSKPDANQMDCKEVEE